MDISKALQRIDDQSVDVIQRMVRVAVDQQTMRPRSFFLNQKEHEIVTVLGPFKGDFSDRDQVFIVQTFWGLTYVLHSVAGREPARQAGLEPQWILDSRILRDEELMSFFREDQYMLVNMDLKKIADFHGHVCPDLVIGAKAVGMAMAHMADEDLSHGLFVIAQNQTSALDAIQHLTGCTIGNQRLVVEDCGKHRYTFVITSSGRALEITMKPIHFQYESAYFKLEKKVSQNGGTIHEVSRLQGLVNAWVHWLTSMEDRDLFSVTETRRKPPPVEVCSRYLRCTHCGDLVQASRARTLGTASVCRPCARLVMHIPQGSWHEA